MPGGASRNFRRAPRLRRPVLSRRVPIVLAVVAFLFISFELARWFTAANRERSAVYALLQDAARGRTTAVTARLQGCVGACAADVAATVRRVRRPGELKLLQFEGGRPPLSGEQTSRVRVAWAADPTGGGRAVVQCVTVRRAWGLSSGASITLLRLSAPIAPETGC